MIRKNIQFAGLFLMLAIILSSCNNTPESKLVGTWKAGKVETDFDENYNTPEMINQIVEMQKETYFKITDDSTLIIMSPGNTFETRWTLDPEDQTISYFFDNDPSFHNKLGVLTTDGKIRSESKTALGIITIYYEND